MQKLFSRMIYNRLQSKINKRLSYDQCAFRPKFAIEDALYVADILLGKCSEYNIPVWAASLDMQKVFDRIGHDTIFEALRYFDVDESLIALIQILYMEQSGTMDGTHYFDILRGVRQGDILSVLLFNAVLDFAFNKWKCKLSSHGWKLDDSDDRLTNIRFADDILMLSKSKEELCEMMTLLLDELADVGLEVNKKTKLLTTESCHFKEGTSSVVNIKGNYFHLLGNHEWHKYLGKYLCFSSKLRRGIEIDHRIANAWAQFNKRRFIFLNKNLSLKKTS